MRKAHPPASSRPRAAASFRRALVATLLVAVAAMALAPTPSVSALTPSAAASPSRGVVTSTVRSGPDSESVARLYRAYFLREPDGAGLRHWTAEHVRGRSIPQISQAFATSEEFRRRYASLDDGAFVDLVYRNVLGRSPDAAGRAHWIGALRRGMSRGTVMAAFSDSAEFKQRTGRVNPGRRVLLIGDSLMHEAGPVAVQRLRELGFVVHLEAHPGSGLLASWIPMDWLVRMQELVETFDPDLVVVEFCCNHWPHHQEDGHPFRSVGSHTPEFRRAWAEAADASVGILTSRGATLSWVTTPPVRDPGLQRLVTQLNGVSAELAVRHGFERIDWGAALAPTGRYQDHVGGEAVRDPDGLHFAPAGSRRAGLATAAWVASAPVNGR